MKHILIGAAFVAAAVSGARAQSAHSLAEDAVAFGTRETNWAPELSPSGRQMLFLSAGKGSTIELDVQDFATGDISVLMTSKGDPDYLRWCDFASETQIICQFTGNAERAHNILTFSRLIVLTTDGKTAKSLGNKASAYDAYINQYDAEVADWLPNEPGIVLVARNYVPQENLGVSGIADTREGLGVDRVELSTMRSAMVEPPLPQAAYYESDGLGRIRIIALQEAAGAQLSGVTRYRYRLAGSRDWTDFSQFDEMTSDGIIPVAVDAATDSAYAIKSIDGRDALVSISLDGNKTEKLIAKNDAVDIDGVVRLDRGMPVIGYAYSDDRTHIVYFNAEYRDLAASLTKALPNKPMVDFASSSADRSKLLIHASTDVDAGAYFLLDRKSREMHPVLLSRPNLEETRLAKVRNVQYKASDGTMIPAFVTVAEGPPGPRPAVVLPHGGPSSRDVWGFDWLAQFFASRGYVVIQPNYRGSSGYGADFLGENAFRDWQTAMSDIDDSAAYLVSEGLADPNRIAIAGWSYGGFAALLSAALHPDRYKAVVAIAPVTDLNAMKSDHAAFTNSKLTKQMIGPKDNAREGSPLKLAANIKAPVLLVHGDMDANVKVDHSLRMKSALDKAGTPVELLEFDKLDHQLEDSDARVRMLTKIGELLDRTIGK